ncbi:MAG: DUF6580 family putative transport protein [Terrimicrobiaceae bacterium]|nr:DUF6580 family putative transport protein [Terrimicrobiaceae bacterium]
MSKLPQFSTGGTVARATWVVVACILAIGFFRVLRATLLPELPNFSPLMAVAFCGGLFLPGLVAWLLPLAVLVVSDMALSAALGFPVFSWGQAGAWFATLVVVALGRWVSSRGRFGVGTFAGSLVVGSVFFYLATNSLSWLVEPSYPRSLEGWWMALTVGLPGFPPTWTFFRNSVASDLLFGGAVLAAWAAASLPAKSPVPLRAEA